MEDKIMMQCWEDLANAIILQAVEDYRDACEALRRRPDWLFQEKRKRSLESFFRSEWFYTLCPLGEKTLPLFIRKEFKENDD